MSTFSTLFADQQKAILRASWGRVWAALNLEAPPGVFAELIESYQAPHRHYHSLQHLGECIALLEPFLDLAERPGEVELSLWFHDAIYDTRAKDNEARSAAWAARVLLAQGAATEVVWRVRELVLATAHQAEPQGRDARLLVDVDLGILSADPKRFAEYERQVRAEYHWVPDDEFRAGRREILRGLLQRPSIYTYALTRIEQQARRNLEGAMAALTQNAHPAPPANSIGTPAAAGSAPPVAPIQVSAERPGVGVGMSLWWVGDSHRREEGEVTVIGMEGTHAKLSNGVLLDVDTLRAIPDPVPRGRCYFSREDKLAAYRLIDEWADFTRDVSNLPRPKGMDVEGILALRAQLGIPDWRKRDHDDAPASVDDDGENDGTGWRRLELGGHVADSTEVDRSPLMDGALEMIRRRVSSAGATMIGCGVVPGSQADEVGARWRFTAANGFKTLLVVAPRAAPGSAQVYVAIRKDLCMNPHPVLWFHLQGGANATARWCLPEFIRALAELGASVVAQDCETSAN